jgi:hypothetical protein
MDANQARYWHLCDGDDLRTRSPRLTWCARRAGVVLAQAHEVRLPTRDASASTVQSTWLPQVVDRFGQLGSLNGAALTLEGESFAARTLITVDVGRGPACSPTSASAAMDAWPRSSAVAPNTACWSSTSRSAGSKR